MLDSSSCGRGDLAIDPPKIDSSGEPTWFQASMLALWDSREW
ncbi:hypothetical protein RISK_004373 [Rhodopirellula islandica]|uniref:Uncharacterized protein n=1 Tax=Rhodopirellula islandica TaxID=595434 RepID=A0A0J1BA39_RHOIS|nr:hypothetical protein RISK_004373 [Rhodopirellula islandica]